MSLRKRLNKLLAPLDLEIQMLNKHERAYQLELYREYPTDSLQNKLFLNVGAGKFYHPYWKCVDKLTVHYRADINLKNYHEWDLLRLAPIAYRDNSIEAIYTGHTLEHVTDEAAKWFCQESRRILKPDGVCRIVLPDMQLAYEAFKKRDRDFFRHYKLPGNNRSTNPNLPLHHVFMYTFASLLSPLSPMQDHHVHLSESEFDELFAKHGMENTFEYFKNQIDLTTQERYPGNHINWYSCKKVISILKNVGFEEVYISGFGQSRCPVLRDTLYFDKQKLQKVSLYVEAIK